MSGGRAIQAALAAAGIQSAVRAARDLDGGCMHRVRAIDLEDGRRLVVKSTRAANAALFGEEAQSLRALAASDTVVVPQPLAVGVFGPDAILLNLFSLGVTKETQANLQKYNADAAV